MTFEEAVGALLSLEGSPVALDGLITRPADPDAPPDSLRWTDTGMLRLDELERPTERAVDEAAWWHRPRHRKRFRIRPGNSALLMWPEKFGSATWDGDGLVIDLAAFRYRLVPLVRPDELPTSTNRASSEPRTP